MNSEERFRQSLEELVNSRDFSFDEDNWEKARQMIDASKKQKRRIVPFVIAGIFLLGSLLTGAYLLQDSPSASGETLAEASKKELKGAPEPSAVDRTQMNPSNPAPGFVKKTLFQAPAPLKEQAPEVSGQTSGNETIVSAAPSPQKTDLVAATPQLTASPEIILESTPGVTNPSTTFAPEPTAGDVQKSDIVPATANIGDEQNTPDKTKEPVKSDESIISVDAAALSIPPVQAGGDLPSSDSQVSTSNPPQADLVETEPSKNEAKPADPQPLVVNETIAKKTEELLKPALPDSVKSNPQQIQELLPADNDQGQLGKPKEVIVLFSIEAGANYIYGWKNPDTRDANGFNPLIGVNYFNNFKQGMSLSMGLHYSTVGRLSYSNYTSKVIRRSLGEESSVTVFTPIKLHYLIAPIRFSYHLDVMNTVGIGCNIAYLLNVESEVETYTEKLDERYDYNLAKTVGYTKGFKQYDTQLSAFYKRRLYPNLAVNLELFFGLTDIKDNTFFNSNVFERNSGLKLTLVYNFLKK